MRKIFLFLVTVSAASNLLGAPLCTGESRTKSPCSGWESLQQLRSLIPERIWNQEFSILIDRKGFRSAVHDWISHPKKEVLQMPDFALACSRYFLLRSTTSGENVRLLDLYEEFQFSPFWKTPVMMGDLESHENQTMKRLSK